MEAPSEVAVGSGRDELVWVAWGLGGVGLQVGRGKQAGEGPRADEAIQGGRPGEVRLVGQGSCSPSELLSPADALVPMGVSPQSSNTFHCDLCLFKTVVNECARVCIRVRVTGGRGTTCGS